MVICLELSADLHTASWCHCHSLSLASVKSRLVLPFWYRLSVWSEVQTCIRPSWCHCHSLSLASVKSRLVFPFWYWLTWVVPEKGPLNGCVCVCVVTVCVVNPSGYVLLKREKNLNTKWSFWRQVSPGHRQANLQQVTQHKQQEAPLSPRDCTMRHVNWNFANCHATVQKLLIQQVLTKSMVWSWRVSLRQCVIDNVHSNMTWPVDSHCLRYHKQTDDGQVVYITYIPTTCCGEIF